MPFTYNYSDAKKLISSARLSSYKNIIDSDSDAARLGAYSWNMAVVGAFYPLIQIVEVALRNAINNAGKEHIESIEGKHWIESICYTQDKNEANQLITAKQVKDFKTKIRQAKSEAQKSLDEKNKGDIEPTLDQIISKTDFATWEYIFDKHYYEGNNNVNANFLWPRYLLKVFKKLPRTSESNPQFHQRDIIRRRIEEIRLFRNRLSHNEPVWRVHSVKNRDEVITLLSQMVEKIMELLFWISPTFKQYIEDIGIYTRITHLLSPIELNRYLHVFTLHKVSDIDSLINLVKESNSSNIKCHFDVAGNQGLLIPNNNKLFQ